MRFKLENVDDYTFYFCAVLSRHKDGWVDLWLNLNAKSGTASMAIKDGNDIGPSMDIPWAVAIDVLENARVDIPEELYEE